MLSLSTFVTRLSWLPAARSKAQFTCRAACWSSVPDPESPYHNPALSKEKTAVLYCASGGRTALAGKTLQELGYKSVYNAGAFKDLAEAGLETEPA
jgi:rhodanese-related sulfurtransferase